MGHFSYIMALYRHWIIPFLISFVITFIDMQFAMFAHKLL